MFRPEILPELHPPALDDTLFQAPSKAGEEVLKTDRRGGGRCGLPDPHGRFFTISGPRRRVTGNGNRLQRAMASRYFGFEGFSSGSGFPPFIQ